MGSWWSDHPELERVARRGRAEISEEASAAEQDAELLRQRRRNLTDVCFEWMSRGDLVTIAVAGHRFEGRLTEAVNDLIIVTTKNLQVAASLERVGFVRSDRKAAFAGTTGDRTVSSFRAELGRYEVDGSPVRLVAVNGTFDLTAVITASTDDHVHVRDQQGLDWALPRREVACAIGTQQATAPSA